MKNIIFALAAFLIFATHAVGQVPVNIGVQILKAEDARRYDATLENLMRSPNAAIRTRAALAAGRIGDDRAIPALKELLRTELHEKQTNESVIAMAAFAIGEIESVKGADVILPKLRMDPACENCSGRDLTAGVYPSFRARLVEAAGKIAAANPKDEKAKQLGLAILDVLNNELNKRSEPSVEVIRLGLTAVLRAKPAGAEETVRKFLAYTDPTVVADALNTLARLHAKNVSPEARDLLKTATDPIIRANAARVLAAAEDKDALDLLIKAATTDTDSRVRVADIRALGSLKDPKAADKLIERGNELLSQIEIKTFRNPVQKNELLEIISSLGRIIPKTENAAAITFISSFRKADQFRTPETEIGLATIAPKYYFENEVQGLTVLRKADPWSAPAILQGYGVIVSMKKDQNYDHMAQRTSAILLEMLEGWFWSDDPTRYTRHFDRPVPDMLRAIAADKSDGLSGIIRPFVDREKDVFIRAAAAELLAEQSKSKENVETLIVAFARSLETDKDYNDAQLAILDAIYKLDKKESVGSLLRALYAPDYIVRKKAFELMADPDLQKEFPEIAQAIKGAKGNSMMGVLSVPTGSDLSKVMVHSGTKLGQVLNTDADYRRALMRRDGTVKAVVATEKGTFTIDFYPEEAPLTVDNFIKLARSGYFNGLKVHRVVPNFVMQDGDPRGDGNGGPGWSIRCEINMIPYDRGAVGMALSGKDTGGSQWFVTHSPQPHLDGGYTVFGHMNETDMKVVDNIVRGDKILNVKIIGR